MMRDYFKKRPDLGLSLALHAFLFFALLSFVLVRSCSIKKPVYVFELTELSETPSTETEQPAPQVQPQPPSQTESVSVERMQLEDFLKEHPRSPKSTKRQTEPVKPPQNRIKQFDALPKFRLDSTPSSPSQPSNEMMRSELQAYGLSIYRRISSQWDQPKFNSEDDFSVEVAFSVRANGLITDIQLIKSSGSQAFDRSILAVFKEIKRFDPTPSEKEERFVMRFKLEG